MCPHCEAEGLYSICRRSKLTRPEPLIATSDARRCNGPKWTIPSFKVPTPKRHVTGTRPCFLRNTENRSVEAPSTISLAMLPPVTAITACPWAVAKAPSSPLFARCRFRRAGEFASNPPARDAKQGSDTRKIRFGHAGIQRNAVAVGFNRFHLRFYFAAIEDEGQIPFLRVMRAGVALKHRVRHSKLAPRQPRCAHLALDEHSGLFGSV